MSSESAHYLHLNVSTHRRTRLTNPTPDDLTPYEKKTRAQVRGNILFFFAVILLLALAWTLQKELLIIYVSGLFAVVLMPAVTRIRQLKIRNYQPSRGVAIVLLIAAVALVLAVFFTTGLPPVLSDLRNFSAELPQRIPEVVARVKRIPFADKLGIDSIAQRAAGAFDATASYLVTSLPLWLSHLFDILTAAFLCIYFMLEGEHAYHFFLSLFPDAERHRLNNTLKKAERKISKWLLGQGLLMLILGVSSTIVFGLLHVRYFLLLGFLMGLFNIIPIAGGVITIVVAAGVAALDSWTKMASVLIFYAIYINIENAVLTPRIMRSSVNLMGLTVLVALLLGTALAGIVGALVSVPTAALITVLLEEYAVQKGRP
ncbi:AI-2E family transporter [Tunturiibacter gelidoferens]|uniref:Putative PurR-regulated permease PerM n=1 Tax=Tunturiibacter lichenicola TaxID=2051959 RepID=A0A7Y9NKB0_9BACT|nr:putative PurR-regulated permease PerM [Edaphobacter lichenicola]